MTSQITLSSAAAIAASAATDSATQRDLLSKLYIHTAGIVASQHRRAAALKVFEADLELRLKVIRPWAYALSLKLAGTVGLCF